MCQRMDTEEGRKREKKGGKKRLLFLPSKSRRLAKKERESGSENERRKKVEYCDAYMIRMGSTGGCLADRVAVAARGTAAVASNGSDGVAKGDCLLHESGGVSSAV